MKIFFAGLITLVLGVCLLWFMAPAVLEDYRIDKQTLQPAPEYLVTEAECRTKLFVMNSCDLEFTHAETGEQKSFDYMLFGRLAGSEVYAMQSQDKRTVTSNIGIENVTNRLLTVVGMGGFLTLLGLLSLIQFFRQRFVTDGSGDTARSAN